MVNLKTFSLAWVVGAEVAGAEVAGLEVAAGVVAGAEVAGAEVTGAWVAVGVGDPQALKRKVSARRTTSDTSKYFFITYLLFT
jgi:hypothetical protein